MSLPWIKLFSSLPRHPKALALDEVTGRRRAWTHMIDLWTWAAEYAPTGDLSGVSDRVIATAAGWRGNASKFVAALEQVGFLAEGRRLHDWDEHQAAHVERAERVASPADSDHPDDKLARRRAQAAERAARKRERDAAAKSERDASRSNSVTERDASVTDSVTRNAESVTQRDGSVTERDASRSPSVTERDENALQRAHAKKEIKIKIKKETEREHTSARESDADDARDDSPAKPDPVEAQITEVLEHWRVCVERPGWAIEGRGAEKRRSRIRSRLADGLTVDQLKRAADGAALDDWLMGRDPKVTKPGGWRDVDTVYRDRPKVEALISLADSPPPVSRGRRPAAYDPKTTDYGPDDPDLLREFGIEPDDTEDT